MVSAIEGFSSSIKQHTEMGAAIGFRQNIYSSLQLVNNRLSNGQAQSCAASFCRESRLKDSFELIIWYAVAVIGHGDFQ